MNRVVGTLSFLPKPGCGQAPELDDQLLIGRSLSSGIRRFNDFRHRSLSKVSHAVWRKRDQSRKGGLVSERSSGCGPDWAGRLRSDAQTCLEGPGRGRRGQTGGRRGSRSRRPGRCDKSTATRRSEGIPGLARDVGQRRLRYSRCGSAAASSSHHGCHIFAARLSGVLREVGVGDGPGCRRYGEGGR